MANCVELVGTEKQILWANEIREKHVAAVDNAIAWMQAKVDSRVAAGQQVADEVIATHAAIVAYRNAAASFANASAWIDRRSTLFGLFNATQAAADYGKLRTWVASPKLFASSNPILAQL